MYEKYAKLSDDAGLTDYRVSVDTGISKSTLSDWKRGEYDPKVDKLMILAKYFNVPIGYFLKEVK